MPKTKQAGYLIVLIPSLFLLILIGCRMNDDQIIGVKIYEQKEPFDKLVSQWNNLGINTAFTSVSLLSNDKFRAATKENGIATFVILPIFFNEEVLEKSPELYAITDKGENASEDWVKFVCPSQAGYRKQKVSEIGNIIREYDPDGISIDFIRHFVFWEMIYPDRTYSSLPNSCFCNLCLNKFQTENNIDIPENLTQTTDITSWILENHLEKWTEWKCESITSMIEDITIEAKKIKPEILINVHIVPWMESDFDGAIKKVAGQDISAISQLTNYLSPMTYAHMVKQPPLWIHRIVKDMDIKAKNKILPSIQVSKAYLNDPLGKHEFEESLKSSLKSPSRGVVLWSWERLAQDTGKMGIVRKIINED